MRGKDQMNIIRRAITWLLTKHETKTMVDHVLDIQGANAVTIPSQPATSSSSFEVATQAVPEAEEKELSALEALKESFAAKIKFIESGVAALGSKAESELVALAEKYL